MQVEHEVVLPVAEFMQQVQVLPRCAAAMEQQQFVEMRMACQQIREFLMDDPVNACVWKSFVEHRQQRQRLDDVTQRAGLDDANPPDLQGVESAIQICGRHE